MKIETIIELVNEYIKRKHPLTKITIDKLEFEQIIEIYNNTKNLNNSINRTLDIYFPKKEKVEEPFNVEKLQIFNVDTIKNVYDFILYLQLGMTRKMATSRKNQIIDKVITFDEKILNYSIQKCMEADIKSEKYMYGIARKEMDKKKQPKKLNFKHIEKVITEKEEYSPDMNRVMALSKLGIYEDYDEKDNKVYITWKYDEDNNYVEENEINRIMKECNIEYKNNEILKFRKEG